MLALLGRKVGMCKGLPAPDRRFLLPSIERIERKSEKQFDVNVHPMLTCLYLKSSRVLPKIVHIPQRGFLTHQNM